MGKQIFNSTSSGFFVMIYALIAERLLAGKRLVTATILSRSGSGPGEPGGMLVLTDDGAVSGTVGGGLLEARTIEVSRTVLADGLPRLLTFDLSAPEVSVSDMLCGGRIEILIDLLDGGMDDHRRIFGKLWETLASGRRAFLIRSILPIRAGDIQATGWGLLAGNDFDPGTLDARLHSATRILSGLRTSGPVLFHAETARCFVQPVDPPESVYIVGAGHIGWALAGVAHIAGFRTIVLDDRPEFADSRRFPQADEIGLIESYARALNGREIHPSDKIVIATRGHLHDKEALAGALRTAAGYIGMIASRRKRDIIFRSLLDEGFTAGDMARVHSPVGLDIGARTPGEIAVSIAAEIVALRSGHADRIGRPE